MNVEPERDGLETPGSSTCLQDGSQDLQAASRAFSFPYPVAYQIQIDLMQHIFRAIEDGKIGIFESPTGTGKSLSLICAAFTWLRKNEKREVKSDTFTSNGEEPDWIIAYEKKKRREEITQHEEELKERVDKMREKLLKSAKESERGVLKRRKKEEKPKEDGDGDSDGDFLVKEEAAMGDNKVMEDDSAFLSPEVRALLEATSQSSSHHKLCRPLYARINGVDEEEVEPETTPKIIYASRTHSQLSQFISELKRTEFGKDIVIEEVGTERDTQRLIRNVSIGSRKQMCINTRIQELGMKAGMEAMNEGCLEVMKKDSKRHCQYLPPSTEAGQLQMLDFRDAAFTSVHDIEDLVELGRKMETCPYFGSRSSARQAQLITIPYNLLLQANARASLNISLKDSIIIIDEAHNLIDTILSIYTVTITSQQVDQAQSQIKQYLNRFSTRLKGVNEVNVRKLSKLLERLSKQCEIELQKLKKGRLHEEIITSSELMERLGENLDQIDLIELESWLKSTQIARKVAGYAEKQVKIEISSSGKPEEIKQQSALSAMHTIESFLLSLSNRDKDGRVLISFSQERDSLSMKYQLLNPSEVFTEIQTQARSVILAGGTMEPVSDFSSQLFAKVEANRIVHHSCRHVIPLDNLMAAVIGKGARGKDFEFKYDARNDLDLLDDLTATIIAYCNVIPHGIVVFLPSYNFLETLVARWRGNDSLQRIASKKEIFYEPKLSSQVECTLRDYTAAASSSGAILFAVVGAKLSEGINFSDRLARAVIMVGMPFANISSPELKERMKYLRDLQANSKAIKDIKKIDAGQELYINLCMKAVNQSIGRAIRHQNDFAALILLDRRYGRRDIQDRLPAWIRSSVKVYENLGPSVAALGTFFREKRSRNVL